MAVVKSNGEEFYSSLGKFHDIVAYLYGPCARHVALRNSDGTVVRMVTSSVELFNYLQPRDDALKLLVNLLKNHCFMYKDGGLFTALLASNMIIKSHSEDISCYVSTNVNRYLLDSIKKLIDKFKIKVDIGKLGDIFSLIKPILWSKLLLRENELMHLSIIFAKSFALSNQKSVSDTNILVDYNSDVMESTLYEGCLLPLGHYPEIDISFMLSNRNVILLSSALSLSSDEFIAEKGSKLVVTSLDEFKDDIVFNQLIQFCTKLISFAGIILCQKVVHPFIKSLFRDNNILCIDRIGAMMMPKLEKLCGCKQVSNLLLDDISSYVGVVRCIENVNLNGKVYLKITSNTDMICSTLLLCGRTEEEIKTLRNCYHTSMTVLQDVLLQPYVLYAGGCFETKLCMELLNLVINVPESLTCSSYIFKKLVLVLTKSLLDVASNIEMRSSYYEHVIDTTFHHHWINETTNTSCCCGLIRKSKHSLNFIDFKELMISDISNISNANVETPLHNDSTSFLCQSKNVYESNIDAAFQAAEIILKIGYQVINC